MLYHHKADILSIDACICSKGSPTASLWILLLDGLSEDRNTVVYIQQAPPFISLQHHCSRVHNAHIEKKIKSTNPLTVCASPSLHDCANTQQMRNLDVYGNRSKHFRYCVRIIKQALLSFPRRRGDPLLMYIPKQQTLVPLQQRIQPLLQSLRFLPLDTQSMFGFLHTQRECAP